MIITRTGPDGEERTRDLNITTEQYADWVANKAPSKEIFTNLSEEDIVFIDADKLNYCTYYDLVFDKVRPGGYIIADNVLWSGKVVEEKKDKDTQAIDAYNKKVKEDKRVKSFILPLRDGLNIAQKQG